MAEKCESHKGQMLILFDRAEDVPYPYSLLILIIFYCTFACFYADPLPSV